MPRELFSSSLSKHLNHFTNVLETCIGNKKSYFPTAPAYLWIGHLMLLWLPNLGSQSMNYTRLVSPKGNMRSFCVLVVGRRSGGAYITTTVPSTPATLFPVFYSLAIFFFLFIIFLYLASNSISFYLYCWNHFSVARVCLMPPLLEVPQIWCVQQTLLSQAPVESY